MYLEGDLLKPSAGQKRKRLRKGKKERLKSPTTETRLAKR
jgi:hypothetical protein